MHETVWDAPAQGREKKTAATYRQMKNATSTQADTWERNNGQENKGVTENDLRFMDKFAKQHEYNALKRQRAK